MTDMIQLVPGQPLHDSAPDILWDVLVIGAGPAGSIVALHLARRGYQVLLLDRSSFPRDKTCGDGLLADSLEVLARADLLEAVLQSGHLVQSASVFSPSLIECNIPGRFLTLRRRHLDLLIAQKAVALGACFCRGEVQDIAASPDGVVGCTLAESGRTYRARVAVIATGANVALLQKLGMVQRRKASGSAVRCYLRSTFPLDRLIVFYDRAIIPGYSWIFPMGNNEFNVGSAIFHRSNGQARLNLKTMFNNFTSQFPAALALLQAGAIISPLVGASLRCGLNGASPVGPGNILAIGETIGATYPSTGEGIGAAMATAELAADVIHQAFQAGDLRRLQAFPARVEEKWRAHYRRFEAIERWLARPLLNDLVAWRGRHSRYYRDALAGILNNDMDPRTAFSLWGILTSFFR